MEKAGGGGYFKTVMFYLSSASILATGVGGFAFCCFRTLCTLVYMRENTLHGSSKEFQGQISGNSRIKELSNNALTAT